MKEQQLTFIVDSNVKYLNKHEHIVAAVQDMLGDSLVLQLVAQHFGRQFGRYPDRQ